MKRFIYYLASSIALVSSYSIAEGTEGPITPELSRFESSSEMNGVLGEHINFQSNTVHWEVRDLHLPANGGLDIEIYRSYSKTSQGAMMAAENWNIEVPRIEFTTSQFAKTNGENTGIGLCSDINSFRYSTLGKQKNGQFLDQTNFSLVIPGQSPKQLLLKDKAANHFPYEALYVTTDNWYVTCVDSSDPNGAGDTFQAHSPDGKIYVFDKIAREPHYSFILNKGVIRAYATQVTDVYGNWLKYNFDSVTKQPNQWREVPPADFKPFVHHYLTKITSSDNQQVSLMYEDKGYQKRLTQMSSNGRNWFYRYDSERNESTDNSDFSTVTIRSQLREVAAPGNQITKYEYKFLSGNSYADYFARPGSRSSSYLPETDERGFYTLLSKVITPQQLEIEYEYEKCPYIVTVIATGDYALNGCYPGLFNKHLYKSGTSPLLKRTVSGKNMEPIVWNFSKIPDTTVLTSQELSKDLQLFIPTQTIVEMPDKKIVHHLYKTGLNDSEYWKHGLVTKKEFFVAGEIVGPKQPIYVEEYTYVKGAKLGDDMITIIDPETWGQFSASQYQRHLSSKKITLDGNQYTTNYQNYNAFGAPRNITEIGTKTRTTNITYENKTQPWIIGLDKSLVEVNGSRRNNIFNSLGQLEQTDVNGIKRMFEYHSDGSLHKESWYKSSISDIQTITYSNYKRGKPQTTLRQDNITLNSSVNNDGYVAWQKDGNQNQTSLDYDDLYRIKSIDLPINADTNISWSDWQNKITTKGTFETTETYDSLGRSVLIKKRDTSGLGKTTYINQQYNAAGQLIFKSRSSSSSSETSGFRYSYDTLGRIQTITDTSNNTLTQYYYGVDANSRIPSDQQIDFGYLIIDGEGNKKIFEYDTFGGPTFSRVKRISQFVETDAKGVERYATTQFEWNSYGNLKSVTQGGMIKTYEYYSDKPDLIKRSVQPEVTTSFDYDLIGNMTAKTINSESTIFTYDSLNRVTKINYPGSTADIDFTYDDNGNVLTTNRGSINWSYSYNENNQSLTEKLTIEGRTFNLSYSYNNNGLLKDTTYPSGRKVEFAPNAFGQPTKVGSFASNIQYHDSGSISFFNYGNGLIYSATRDARNLPTELKVADGLVAKSQLKYTYDNNSNIKAIRDSKKSYFYRDMTYDGLDRLITANGNDFGNLVFDYDDLGNIKSKTIAGSTINYHYNTKNQLNSISGVFPKTYSYDDYGNISSNGINSYTYNNANELIRTSGNTSEEYSYDGNNRRLKVIRDKTTAYHIYNKSGKLLHKFDASKNQGEDYIYLQSQLLAKVDSVVQPGLPSNLRVQEMSGISNTNHTKLLWDAGIWADTYNIEQSFNRGGWTLLSQKPAAELEELLLDISQTGTYEFRIKSCNAVGCSAYSNVVKTWLEANVTPAVPTSLTVPEKDSDGRFQVSWKALKDANSFNLQRKSAFTSWVTTYSGDATSNNETVTQAGLYDYRVQACNDNGCSEWSAPVSISVVFAKK